MESLSWRLHLRVIVVAIAFALHASGFANGYEFPDLNFIKARAPLISVYASELVPLSDKTHYHLVQNLFPGIGFTCSGSISEWTVVASYQKIGNPNAEINYVPLELWRTSDGTNYTQVKESPLDDVLPTSTAPRLYTQQVDPPLHFEAGDVLGVYGPYVHNSQARLHYMSTGGPKNYAMKGINERNKLGTEEPTPVVMNVERDRVDGVYHYPLVAPKASPRNCAYGFLSTEELRLVVEEVSIATLTGPTAVSMCYADLYFTCAGSINKILFGGKQTATSSTTQWPQLQIYSCDIIGDDLSCDPVPKTTIPLNNTQKTSVLYEQTFDPPVQFDANDRLGLYQPAEGESQVEVYFEEGELLESFDSSYNNSLNCTREPDLPLVAIETDSLINVCVGSAFLSEDQVAFRVGLLENVMPVEDQQRVIPELKFDVEGNVAKLIFVASPFFLGDRPGYPELQVWRVSESNSDVFTLVHSTRGLVPSSTGDTNLYQYVLEEPWPVMAGDFLGMFVPDREEAKLTFYTSNVPEGPVNFYFANANNAMETFNLDDGPLNMNSIPLVSVEFTNNTIDQPPTSTETYDIPSSTSSLATTSETTGVRATTPVTPTQTSTPTPAGSMSSLLAYAIIAAVVIIIVLVSAVVLIVTVFVVLQRRKKSFSPRGVGQSSLQNPIYDGGLAKADASYSEPLDTMVNFVPTAEERTRYDSIASVVRTTSACYSYTDAVKLDTILRSAFMEKDEYWEPASDPDQLYDQMAQSHFPEIPRERLIVGAFLGSGEFGVVNKGKWDTGGGEIQVALKVLKDNSLEAKTKFLQEAAIIGQFSHANIIRLCGVVTVGKPMMIVLEYMTNGSLKDFLPKMNSMSQDLPKQLLRFCYQVASGGKYLCGKNFVHRDIAARNILVSNGNMCKIADFGMSRNLDEDNYYQSSGGKVPVKWSSPEAINFKKYSSASDIWSYGVLMFEIWSLGKKPFQGFDNITIIHMVGCGYRLAPPPGCPRAVYELMIDCWHPEKDMRPDFAKVESILHQSGDDALLAWSEEDKAVHPQASELGAPLEAGKALYPKLQNLYLT